MRRFLESWTINTLAVLVASYILSGVHWQKFLDLLAASLLLGILNTVVRPILLLIALPMLIFTLGLFIFVINALVLYFVSFLLRPHFYVDGFWDAFWAALIITIVSTVLNIMIGRGRVQLRASRKGPSQGGDGGGGPVIDV